MFPQFLQPLEPGPQNYLEQMAELDLEMQRLKKRRKREFQTTGCFQSRPIPLIETPRSWFKSDPDFVSSYF